ncbi:MAG: glycosyltransferase family 4 protein [Sulfuricellaceae bacterium]|nr:glycosyltransferase family 4 protein [Sulfuricellaceae bacterium]
MNVLLLSRYGNLGASSRIRSYQYLPYLREQGIEVTLAPLLPDDYLRDLYAGKRPAVIPILAAYVRRIGALMQRQKFDLLWVEYEIFPWLPGWLESLLLSKATPYLVDYDDAIFHRYDLHTQPLVRRLLGHKIDSVMRHASTVVVGSEYLRDHAIKAGARRVEMLPPSIDLARYPSPTPAQNEMFTIGWIGSPTTTRYLHRVHDLLADVCMHDKARVVLVGASDLGWQDVPHAIHPWSENTEVADIGGFDIGIMPLESGPWELGKCGYKLIQYMACGKPVVASPVGINTRIVEPGINGYLAETKHDWVQALTALMADAGSRRDMGAAGRTKVERDYTVQLNAPRLAAMLRTAAGQA